MVSDELRDRIAKNELLGDEIVNYVLKYFFWGYKGITVEEISITVAKMRLQNLFDVNEEVEESFILPDDIGTGTTAITIGNFQKLNKMLEEYRKEEIEIEKLKSSVPIVHDFIQELIKIGLLYPDGKRATGKLDDIVRFFRDKDFQVRARFLKQTFLQDSGKKWSDSAIDKALEILNQ